jgi:tetratricopeptide (TPR) repeat protein
LHLKGELVLASKAYKKILSSNPKDQSALYGLALCAFHRGDYRVSCDILRECIEINEAYLPARDLLLHLSREYRLNKGTL